MTPAELVARVVAEHGGTFAVTGATGWFGATTLDLLYEVLGEEAPDRVVGYASAPRTVRVADGREVAVRPLAELASQAPAPTWILHYAYLTRDKVAEVGVDAYVRRNVAITALVLDAVARHRPRYLVTTSSGAVYGRDGRLVADVDGDPYGALKHVDELALRTAGADVGACVVVPRVFSVAGARMTKPEKYALGSLLGMAAAGGPLEIRATAPVVRSYCGVDEVVALSVWAAAAGRSLVFDSGGPVVEISELAEVVADLHGLGTDAVVRRWDPDAEPNRYVGEVEQMDALAREAGLSLRSLPELVADTAAWLGRLDEVAT